MIKIKDIEGIGLAANSFILTDVKTGISAIIDAGLSKETFEREAKGYDIRYVLLTHGHYDHISLADYICEACGAELIIHKNDIEFLTNPYLNLSEPFGFPPVTVNTVPKTVTEDDIIYLGETEIKIMLTAGHTMGSVCYIAENAMFSGDTLFFNSIGRTDFPTSDVDTMVASLSRLDALQQNYDVYCGHGEDTSLQFEKRNNIYLSRLV